MAYGRLNLGYYNPLLSFLLFEMLGSTSRRVNKNMMYKQHEELLQAIYNFYPAGSYWMRDYYTGFTQLIMDRF